MQNQTDNKTQEFINNILSNVHGLVSSMKDEVDNKIKNLSPEQQVAFAKAMKDAKISENVQKLQKDLSELTNFGK
jgi:hypothetical protein